MLSVIMVNVTYKPPLTLVVMMNVVLLCVGAPY
jgi:hypothetical protein